MTFRDPRVLEALAEFALLKVDIDVAENRELCRRYHGGGGVPTFVAVDADGDERLRWVGALPSDQLVEKLAEARNAKKPELTPEASHLQLCEKLEKTADWRSLAREGRSFLAAYPESPRREAVELWVAIAEFERTGELGAELRQRIDTLIATLDVPFPGSSLDARLRRLLGKPQVDGLADRNSSWVETSNESMHALAEIGRAARTPLHELMLRENAVGARRASTALGWMRLADTPALLVDHVTDASIPARNRAYVVECIGAHKDPSTLDLLIDRLADVDEHPTVRSAAADAIKGIVVVSGGTTRRDIARALERGLEEADAGLRRECLQAMFEVRAPLDLELLLALLSDRRPLFADFEIRDNALWVLLNQLDKNIRTQDGELVDRCSREVAAFLRAWHAGAKARLHWDGNRYVLR